MIDNKLIACCGINCENCDARIATVNDDNDLRARTAALWCKLNNTDVVKPEHINCLGCLVDGPKTVFCTTMCVVRKCCIEKGYRTCAECSQKNTCKDLGVFISAHGDAYDRIISGSK